MGIIIWFALWAILLIGWVMNIVQVIGMALADHPATTLFITKCIGIPFGPLGGVLGWVTAFN